jgi:Mg2+ and Co2+ transporter CorA
MIKMIPPSASGKPAIWIDLVSPTEQEIQQVEHQYGIKVPDVTALKEIETTSRLRTDGSTLYMSAPMIAGGGAAAVEHHAHGLHPLPSPLPPAGPVRIERRVPPRSRQTARPAS